LAINRACKHPPETAKTSDFLGGFLHLPRQDSNLNKESQNPMAPHLNVNPDCTLDAATAAGCSAGCSEQQSDGGNTDPALAALVAAWPTLPEPIRRAMLALICAAAPTAGEGHRGLSGTGQ
jgi:hypothetical protein